MFRFRKLYVDLVTADGTVCVAYLARLHVLGVRTTHAGVEIYGADGKREVIRARALSHRLDAARGEIVLSLDVPGGPFVLTQGAVHGPWAPSGPSPCRGLSWRVLAARTAAHARWLGAEGRELHGLGYADWVEIERPTRLLRLSRLRWGRVHLPDATVVFNAVHLRSGESWQRSACWSAGGPIESTGLSMAFHAGQLDLAWRGRRVRIEPVRTLHAGEPIDPSRFPGAIERLVSNAITGPAEEERCLGRARWLEESSAAHGWALHETVRFGAAASGRSQAELGQEARS